MVNKRNILIVGNSGFIGKSIYNNLISCNSYKTIGLNSEICNLLNNEDCNRVLKNLIKVPTTVIFLSTYWRLPNDDFNLYNKNTKLITNFLNNINSNLIEQFIFYSSTCLYGRPPKKIPIKETLECFPNGYYSLSKLVSENLIKLHLSCPIAILRIPGVYGELDNNRSIIGLFIDKIINNDSVNIYDEGLALRDYVYIKDIIEITKHIIQSKANITLNIASGASKKLIDLLRIIENNLNKKANVNYLKSIENQFDMTFDIDNLIKFMPQIKITSMEKGIIKKISSKLLS